jgi:hypothetical protein
VAETGGYPALDEHIVDYEVFDLAPLSGLRGPKPPLDPRSFFVCIGAAQTYGRLCRRPFPTLLSDELSLPALNLGTAGAGPLLFLRRPQVFEYINRARFAIVQMMSARGEDNSYFESLDFGILRKRSGGDPMLTFEAYRELLETEDEALVRDLVAETRRNFVRYYQQLLDRIEVPTVLLWFARRKPDYAEDYSEVLKLFGGFPQLVDGATMDEIRPHADAYVECITSRGLPQPLFDRFTGEQTSMRNAPAELGGRELPQNYYYPSPEMHEDAAAALLGPARAMLRSTAVAT